MSAVVSQGASLGGLDEPSEPERAAAAPTPPDDIEVLAWQAARCALPCTTDAQRMAADALARVLGWELLDLLRRRRGAGLGRLQARFDALVRGL